LLTLHTPGIISSIIFIIIIYKKNCTFSTPMVTAKEACKRKASTRLEERTEAFTKKLKEAQDRRL